MISFQTDILPLKNELYRLALRITMNAAEAEDVVQETMLKVWNRREQWNQIESIEAFCLTICRNLSLDKMRRMDNQTQSLDATYDPKDQHVVTASNWCANSSASYPKSSVAVCSCATWKARAIKTSLPF